MSDILEVTGRVALVTGAGQGVGKQVAEHLAAHGATVIVNDYFLERAQAVAKDICDAGGKAHAVQADVTDYANVKAMVAQVRDLAGPVDVLVNNAGNLGANPSPDGRKPFWEVGPEVWRGAVDVNLYGVINCTSAVIPDMIERKSGRLITIISDAGRVGQSDLEVYSAAKAGAAGLMRAVARSMGRYQVTANCVAIAATLTPPIEARLKDDPERLKKMMSHYVIRRPGRPTDVANMVLFLASGASDWITGQTYPVNGGFSFSM
ncbi:SDR family oxidoreductase [Burkholderia sp. BCC0405]|jgi:2-hydroxycyclohexanecarboxyl-CoA dehydrogenase|uniref:SDR family NAD(P)-dependent oxidoreductase n=1 Tax=Burkholderia sp. BCC0405 TaxID=2676298 RepID=UPI00158A2D27|nr:SDR family oxidoreductase [Burkholderia sp. BCC0405]